MTSLIAAGVPTGLFFEIVREWKLLSWKRSVEFAKRIVPIPTTRNTICGDFMPVLILGSLDGIETGVRQLIRSEPLETTVIEAEGARLTVPTKGEMFRIKAVLALKRNATRDYLLDETDLSQYKHLDVQYQDWNHVRDICAHIAVAVIHQML